MDREFEITARVTISKALYGRNDIVIRLLLDKSDIYIGLWSSGDMTISGQYGPTAKTFYSNVLEDIPSVLAEKIKEYAPKD